MNLLLLPPAVLVENPVHFSHIFGPASQLTSLEIQNHVDPIVLHLRDEFLEVCPKLGLLLER